MADLFGKKSFEKYPDRDPSDADVICIMAMHANKEISDETRDWLLGYIDIDEKEQYWKLGPKARRRFFAIRAAEHRCTGVLEKSRGHRMQKKKRISTMEYWTEHEAELAE